MVQFTLYVDRDTILHRLDPRSKLIWLVCVWLWAMSFNHPAWTFVIFLVVIVFAVTSRSMHHLSFAIKGLISLFIMAAIMWPLFREGFTPIYTLVFPFGKKVIYYETVLYALAMSMRFFAMITAGLVYFATTRMEDLSVALAKMRIPYGLNFGFTTIFRFIPTMYGEAQLIFLAQEARGVDLRRGSIFQKIKNTVPTIAPLFITTLRRAGELVMAIESRAFLLKKERTSYYEIKFKLGDYILVIFSIILTVFFLWLRIQGYGIVLPTAI